MRLLGALLALVLVAAALPVAMLPAAYAVEPSEVLKDKALEKRARAISKHLRCLVCQNQSIDDSDAGLARDLRILVRERLTAGDSDEAVEVTPSTHAKCERCWHYTADVGADAAHAQLCARCVSNLYGAGEDRRHA